MAELLETAPKIQPGTLILLTNVPRDDDPFTGDNSWFDMALRLAYPGTRVAGAYWHADGTSASGAKPDIEENGNWRLDNGSLVHQGGPDSILAIAYSETGRASVEKGLPEILKVKDGATKFYNPTARIAGGPPPERVRRRFRLNSAAH